MEENGDEYIGKLDSFLKTMNTRVNRSTGKAPKSVTNKDLLSIFFTETQLTNICNRVLKWVKLFVYQKKIFPSEKVINLSSQVKSSKLLKLLLLNHHPIIFVENKVMKYKVSFMNKSFQSVSYKDEFFHC